jgi:hypothetical protein
MILPQLSAGVLRSRRVFAHSGAFTRRRCTPDAPRFDGVQGVQKTFVTNLTRAADPFRVFFAGGSAFTSFTLTAEEDLGRHPSAPRA